MATYQGVYSDTYGPYGAAAPVQLPAPTGLVLMVISATEIDVSWNAIPNATTSQVYQLQRAVVTNGVAGSFVPVNSGLSTSYADTGRTPAATYAYRVLATTNGNYATSNPSTVVQATTPPVGAPFTVSVDAQRVATLSNIPAGSTATDYEYQFRPGPTVSGQRVVGLTQTLAAGESATDYEYQTR